MSGCLDDQQRKKKKKVTHCCLNEIVETLHNDRLHSYLLVYIDAGFSDMDWFFLRKEGENVR